MKYFEMENLIGDNEFTLCIDYPQTGETLRIYKDDGYDEIVYEFGFADVVTIDTSYGDLTIYIVTDDYYADGETMYKVIAHDKSEGLTFLISEHSDLESAEKRMGYVQTWYPHLTFDIEPI